MALNKVEICGVNTSELPVLKTEEKEELFRRIKEGDEIGTGALYQRKSAPCSKRDPPVFRTAAKTRMIFSRSAV